jgi:hypothetical protein
MKRISAFVVFVLLVACGTSAPAKYPWTIVGSQGVARMIYLDPAALKDTQFLGELVSHLTQPGTISQLMFFDDRAATPSALPMDDTAMLHWRAQYDYNPNTGLEKFVFVEVSDKNTSPPTLTEATTAIRRR